MIESNDSSDVDLATLTLTAYWASGNNSDLIVGEKITGLIVIIAMVVEKPNVTRLGIVFLNQNRFNIGETVKAESLVSLHYSQLQLLVIVILQINIF